LFKAERAGEEIGLTKFYFGGDQADLRLFCKADFKFGVISLFGSLLKGFGYGETYLVLLTDLCASI
jgi:hypothetical protein